MWSGHAFQIRQRQGDIALVAAPGPRLPARLPEGHVMVGDCIVHAQHPPLRLPQKGERIIIARRASPMGRSETRD